MEIKITARGLSIPPYLSTSWSAIAALQMRGDILAITLISGEVLQIPNLDASAIQEIFKHHAAYLESDQSVANRPARKEPRPIGPRELQELFEQGPPSSVQFAFGIPGMPGDGFVGAMQHDPAHRNAPNLPDEMLQKIGMITKIISPTDAAQLPRPEQGCNCFHCQIARAMGNSFSENCETTIDESDVQDSDLQFEQWGISQTGDKLYTVTNKLDTQEKYSVFLGEPVGCTCGHPNCEHILAVLRS